MENNVLQPKNPWYRTYWGIILLIILGLVIIVVLIFGGFFIYYSLQVKYGDISKVNQEFVKQDNGEKTLDNFLSSSKKINNINQYVRNYNPTFGNQSAPITILAFVDFACPFCQQTYPEFKTVMTKYEPVIRVVFKYLPSESVHPQANIAAESSACAQEQNKFWSYHNQLFIKKDFKHASLLTYAKDLNLYLNNFTACLDTNKYQGQISQDLSDAADLDVQGTPTYFVNGVKIDGTVDAKTWDKIILYFLK